MATIKDITLVDFFTGIFPGAFICAMTPTGAQIEGEVPFNKLCQQSTKTGEVWGRKWEKLNNAGYNIHFCPNSLKDGSTTNKGEHFEGVNAWWVDIDIEETKDLGDKPEEMLAKRQEGKNNILGKIFGSQYPLPSLLNETRNGYQAIWFAKYARPENFDRIQQGLVREFNGDIAAGRRTSMLRVPEMKYYKRGETGVINSLYTWSTCKLYDEELMLSFSPASAPLIPTPVYFSLAIKSRGNCHGIWDKLDTVPVREQIARLSGHWLVNGETLIVRGRNIWSNNNPTPNWIDEKCNGIFSQNQAGFRSALHFCMWYGHDKQKVTNALKELFNL